MTLGCSRDSSSSPGTHRWSRLPSIRDHNRSGKEIALDRDELTSLARLFHEAPDLLTAPEFGAFRHLNDEVVVALKI